jgi:colanic acid biosynthesis protein WcaH
MNAPRFLAGSDFARIVRLTPLVSIDIVVKDPQGCALLGLRVNEPAKDKYFVPGDVICKNESIQDAFARILNAEIGIKASPDDAAFLGVFEHFYDTNRFGDPDYGTHYVVLAYEICIDQRPLITMDSQHSHVRWMSAAKICVAEGVHPNTKAYISLERPTAQP